MGKRSQTRKYREETATPTVATTAAFIEEEDEESRGVRTTLQLDLSSLLGPESQRELQYESHDDNDEDDEDDKQYYPHQYNNPDDLPEFCFFAVSENNNNETDDSFMNYYRQEKEEKFKEWYKLNTQLMECQQELGQLLQYQQQLNESPNVNSEELSNAAQLIQQQLYDIEQLQKKMEQIRIREETPQTSSLSFQSSPSQPITVSSSSTSSSFSSPNRPEKQQQEPKWDAIDHVSTEHEIDSLASLLQDNLHTQSTPKKRPANPYKALKEQQEKKTANTAVKKSNHGSGGKISPKSTKREQQPKQSAKHTKIKHQSRPFPENSIISAETPSQEETYLPKKKAALPSASSVASSKSPSKAKNANATAQDQEEQQDCCAYCGATSNKKNKTKKGKSRQQQLLACAGCQQVLYCNSKCQKAHWKTHKPFCKKYSQRRKRNEMQQQYQYNTGTNIANVQALDIDDDDDYDAAVDLDYNIITWQDVRSYDCLVARGKYLHLTLVHVVWGGIRFVASAQDVAGQTCRIAAYTDSRQIPGWHSPGQTILWKNPRFHYFLDGSCGARIEEDDLPNIYFL